jgi:fructose-1-phosphate kinase PfkB-like protein
VAAGTASAMQPGMKFASFEDTREVFERVDVRRVD